MATESGDLTKKREEENPQDAEAGLEVPLREAPLAEQSSELSAEEKDKQAIKQLESSIREWIKERIKSGYSGSQLDPKPDAWGPQLSDADLHRINEAVRSFDELHSDPVVDLERSIIFKVYEEFAPIGSKIRSLFERTKIKESEGDEEQEGKGVNDEMLVTYDQDYGDYVIFFPNMKTGGENEPVDQLMRISEIPEVAKEVFDHNLKVASEKSLDGPALYEEMGEYLAQIALGKGFEKENGDKVVENFEKMEGRLEVLRKKGLEIAKKFGTDVPIEIRQVATEKRAQVIAEWKQQLAELQKKDQIDKIKKSIENI